MGDKARGYPGRSNLIRQAWKPATLEQALEVLRVVRERSEKLLPRRVDNGDMTPTKAAKELAGLERAEQALIVLLKQEHQGTPAGPLGYTCAACREKKPLPAHLLTRAGPICAACARGRQDTPEADSGWDLHPVFHPEDGKRIDEPRRDW